MCFCFRSSCVYFIVAACWFVLCVYLVMTMFVCVFMFVCACLCICPFECMYVCNSLFLYGVVFSPFKCVWV